MKAIKVTLRAKKISKGRKSLYLDFYPALKNPNTGKETRREFLRLYTIDKPKNVNETQSNKQSRALAEKMRNQRFSEIHQGIYGFQSETKRSKSFLDFFEELIKKRFTSQSNFDTWRSAFHYINDYFVNDLKMGELSVNKVEEFRDYLLGLSLAQNTKHTYYNKFKAAVKEAFRKGLIPENYAARVDAIKAEETKIEFVTWEELRLLNKTECDKPLVKKAFLFSALTGLRFSDIEKLTWNDLQGNDKKGYFIRFRQKKTKAHEKLDLPNLAYELIGERKAPEQKIFKGLKYSAWTNVKIKEWVLRAGIKKKITFHCARHSFATIMLDLGIDLYTVSKLLGHKEIRTTQVYAKVMDKNKKAAMEKLNNLKF